MKNKLFFLALLIAFSLKLYFGFQNYNFKEMVWDEESNYKIALQHYNTGVYPQYAFHGTGTVFLYELTLQLGISKSNFIKTMFVLNNLLYLWSIYIFYLLSNIFLDKKYSITTAIIYAFYPSTIYFIGSYFLYENISTYILIYVSYLCIKIINKEHLKNYTILYSSILISISCYLRAHLIAFYLIMFISMWLMVLYKKKVQKVDFGMNTIIKISITTLLFFAIFHYPILLKNEKLFGKKILSTQTGFELLQGHNPYATGIWNVKYYYLNNDSLRIYCNQHIKDNARLDELQQSEERKKLALSWIKENPSKELQLELKKIKLFFNPANMIVVNEIKYFFKYNPINIFIHFLFFLSLIIILINNKIDFNITMISLPVMSSLLISIVFFVGTRWRFYAEPFMILIAMIGLNNICKLAANHFNKKIIT